MSSAMRQFATESAADRASQPNGRAANLSRVALLMCMTSVCHAAADELTLAADRPSVTIVTRSDDRNFIRLPSLAYRIAIRATCDGATRPVDLSVGVADTREIVEPGTLQEDGTAEFDLTIPAGQIAPLALQGFCADSGAASSDRLQLEIHSILSLHGSMLCAGETLNRRSYAATALGVTLDCHAAEAAESDSVRAVDEVPGEEVD